MKNLLILKKEESEVIRSKHNQSLKKLIKGGEIYG